MKSPFFCGLLFLFALSLSAQTAADSITVEAVTILGHKKTRSSTIFREMPFGRGDRIAIGDLDALVREARANLMNTGLFVEATISYDDWEVPGNRVSFTIELREAWYIYPVPVFELADRNFNVWWREQNRDLNRVNIGLKFTHYNFTGRRDKLKLGYQYGYTREYDASYDLPYLNRAQNIGLRLRGSYSRRREQNYLTVDNQQSFYEDEDNFVYRKTIAEAEFTYRKKLYTSSSLTIGYTDEKIADTIAHFLNPNFFSAGRSKQRFFRLSYEFRIDKRDVREYPWEGYYVRFRVNKDGLGILNEREGLTLWGDYRKYTPIGKKGSINTSLGFKYSLSRQRQPFLENRAVGFGDYNMVGYQFYVIDGLDMVILRTGYRREILRGELDLGKLVFIDAFRYIPFRVMISTAVDQGWANAPYDEGNNPLTNQWLIGGSLGLDVVLFYDMVMGIQLHRNHLRETNVLLKVGVNL